MTSGENVQQTQMPEGAVRIERAGDVAFIVIDNPPVNASSWRVRSDLLSALSACSQDASLAGIILIGAGKIFMAGADLKEFDAPLCDPQMPAVIKQIEDCPLPVVGAIAGPALGAGFELALGCDARIAMPDAIVGLPEVMLGVIPGAGGTQRLPRLVGVATAIELIANGRRLKAPDALAAGMIDAVANTDLRSQAMDLARSFAGRKRRVSEMDVPPEAQDAIEAAAVKVLAQSRGAAAEKEAVESIRRSVTMPFAEALTAERAAFQTLRESREAAAKRYLFFSERDVFRVAGLEGCSPRPIKTIGVVGAGTMGAAIAMCFLDSGLPVTLIERDSHALDAGLARIQSAYKRMTDTGRISADDAAQRVARISPSIDLGALSNVDLALEAAFEDLGVKQALFRDLDRVLKADAIIASNTSYLDLDSLAHETGRPSAVVGLHFFAPANIMRLLEVVRGAATAPDVLATALEVARKIRKLPVVARVADGFIGNRVYSAYRKQCEFMLEEGAFPQEVDDALVRFGFAMGPFAVADLSGLDIAWRTRQRLAATRDARERYSDVLDKVCEAGRLGQKAGKGWYTYPEGARRGAPDGDVAAIIIDASQRKGITRRAFSAGEIVRRALIAMVNEAALLLAEGVAERGSDVDLVMVNGYGFPSHKGGPLFWASRERRADVHAWAQSLNDATGFGFKLGPIDSALDELMRK